MPSVEVIIPYLAGCRHRARALDWVRARYSWPVTVAPGPDPWIKAQAVNPAVAQSRAHIIVLADADVWHPGLGEAITAVEQGAGWAIPHRGVCRLTEAATQRYMAGADLDSLPFEQRPYLGVPGGGYVVATRRTLTEIPMDPRFVGWGQEDVSFGMALATLAGIPWRGRNSLAHLWHPPQQRMTRKYGNPAGKALCARYRAAQGKPEQMRALLDEHRAATESHRLADNPQRVGVA